jgi:hypothetical protein
MNFPSLPAEIPVATTEGLVLIDEHFLHGELHPALGQWCVSDALSGRRVVYGGILYLERRSQGEANVGSSPMIPGLRIKLSPDAIFE